MARVGDFFNPDPDWGDYIRKIMREYPDLNDTFYIHNIPDFHTTPLEPRGEGIKYDTGKLRWDLLPLEEIEKIVEVLSDGAEKYDDNNWKELDNPKERYFAALMRHLVAYRKGEILDPESGRTHLAHAATNLIFLMYFNNGED
jgi:hypothetical protein